MSNHNDKQAAGILGFAFAAEAAQDRKKLEQERAVSALMEELLWFRHHAEIVTSPSDSSTQQHIVDAAKVIADAQAVFNHYTAGPEL